MSRQPSARSRMEDPEEDSDVPMTPERQAYPRRFPRLGSQFQTRISKSIEPSDRPSPLPMSVEFPYLTTLDVDEQQQQQFTAVSSFTGQELQSGLPKPDTFKQKQDCETARIAQAGVICGAVDGHGQTLSSSAIAPRGGLLIHRPLTTGMDEYTTFCRPLVTSLPAIASQASPDEQASWKQHMIQLHQAETRNGTKGKRSRAARGGAKRKRETSEDTKSNDINNSNKSDQLVWRLEEMLQNQQHDKEKKKKRRSISDNDDMGGEEQACVMEHLHATAGGNVEVAKFSTLVQFSAGQASKMRKTREKKWTKQKARPGVLHPTTETWRELYQRMQFPSLLGQLQDDTLDRFPFGGKESSVSLGERDGQEDVFFAFEAEDDMKDTWRSILTCAKSIERQLTGDAHGDKKPLLSTILTFVANAYALPRPEACFGTNHVMIEELSSCFVTIIGHAGKAQESLAKIRDKLYNSSGEGVESDALLNLIETEFDTIPIRSKEIDDLLEYQKFVVEWETRVASLLDLDDAEVFKPDAPNTLQVAETLKEEAKAHGYVSKILVQLDTRIKKAYDLRGRIRRWEATCMEGSLGSTKTLNALVKEANRVKLVFPEASEIIETHCKTEDWIERANIGCRSRTSLKEIKTLLQLGNEMPLDLSEYEEKLESRARSADEWWAAMEEVVSVPSLDDGTVDHLGLMEVFRRSLLEGGHGALHDLALEGSRIPVDVDEVKMLQVAMDAKLWTSKAEKWIPTCQDSKKGKLAEVREHADKALELRERLPFEEKDKEAWVLQGEKELDDIVEAADAWFDKNIQHLEADKRRNCDRECLSIAKLRSIVNQGNAIYVNLGNATSKMSRILAEAEAWYTDHLPLLRLCNLAPSSEESAQANSKSTVTLEDFSKAADAAKADVSLDLEEAANLRRLLDKIGQWAEQASLIAPKRSKRTGKASRSKFTVDDLIRLIEDASTLPVDTTEDVNRLQMQLSNVQVWRSHASAELEKIAAGFRQLHSHVESLYGPPSEFNIDLFTKSDDKAVDLDDEKSRKSVSGKNEDAGMKAQLDRDEAMEVETSSSSAGDLEDRSPLAVDDSDSDLNVFRTIKDLQEGAKDNEVTTLEGDLGDLLHNVAQWTLLSFKYLNSPRDVFDKRYFGAFDRFLKDGRSLIDKASFNDGQSNDLSVSVCGSFRQLVSDQLERLGTLKQEREKFIEWCRMATQLLGDEKKLTKEKLDDLTKNGRHFPAGSDVVSKIRSLAVKVAEWTDRAREEMKAGKKLDMQYAKALLDSGEKLKVNSEELRLLKAEFRATRMWSSRVRKCNNGQSSMDVNDIKQLIKEHDSLLIELPEELEELQQATVGYCICRRPYEGFMIGCDHCEEWYHGVCVGVTESRAERCEKYACIRCSSKKCFEMGAAFAAGLIRKWTCRKDLRKARQVDYQKIQRKFRKEKKDIEKMELAIAEAERQLRAINGTSTTESASANGASSVPVSTGDFIQMPSSLETVDTKDNSNTNLQLATTATPATTEDNSTVAADGTASTTATTSPWTTPNVLEAFSRTPADATPAFCCTNQNGSNGDAGTLNEGTASASSAIEKKPEGETQGEPSKTTTPFRNEAIVRAKLEKMRASIQAARDRLEVVNEMAREKKLLEKKEDEHSANLRKWCLLARAHVLVPSQAVKAEAARPSFGVALSPPMSALLADAKELGISHFSDVHSMINYFKSMSWSLSSMAVLQRKPQLQAVTFLVKVAENLKLPDEKALRTMKYMQSRTAQFQLKLQKALSPRPGETKPISVSFLRELDDEMEELPVEIPEAKKLVIVLQDKGARYCVCGGPRDGSPMLCCEACKKLFHEKCMHVKTANEEDGSKQWTCPSCSGSDRTQSTVEETGLTVSSSADERSQSDEASLFLSVDCPRSSGGIVPHAPDPTQLWPPFGLLGSKSAIEILGFECASIPDPLLVAVGTAPVQSEPVPINGIKSAPVGTAAIAERALNTASASTNEIQPVQNDTAATNTPVVLGTISKPVASIPLSTSDLETKQMEAATKQETPSIYGVEAVGERNLGFGPQAGTTRPPIDQAAPPNAEETSANSIYFPGPATANPDAATTTTDSMFEAPAVNPSTDSPINNAARNIGENDTAEGAVVESAATCEVGVSPVMGVSPSVDVPTPNVTKPSNDTAASEPEPASSTPSCPSTTEAPEVVDAECESRAKAVSQTGSPGTEEDKAIEPSLYEQHNGFNAIGAAEGIAVKEASG